MGKKRSTEQAAAEYPKPLVKLVAGPAGYTAEVRLVADSDEEATATGEGYQVVDVPPSAAIAYPKWVYHADGSRQIVETEAALEKLGEGWDDAPVETETDDTVA